MLHHKEIKSLDVTEDAFKLKLYTDNFVRYMNLIAKELNMKNTYFVNPHGLDAKEAYSSVEDLAILTKYTLSFPAAVQIMETKSYKT